MNKIKNWQRNKDYKKIQRDLRSSRVHMKRLERWGKYLPQNQVAPVIAEALSRYLSAWEWCKANHAPDWLLTDIETNIDMTRNLEASLLATEAWTLQDSYLGRIGL
jgi:hypothetical protein